MAENIGSSSLRDLDRRFKWALVSLFNLAAGIACEPLAIQVGVVESTTSWCDVYSSSLRADSGHGGRADPSWLLQPEDLVIKNIATWLDQVDVLGPLPPGVADLVHGETISVESQVLQLTSVAEGLHRVLHPRQKRYGAGRNRLGSCAMNTIADG